MSNKFILCTTFVISSLGAASIAADDVDLAALLQQDGPYIDIPAGYEVPTGPPSLEDIVRLADLDGDPSNMTATETEMISVLLQVLIGVPITQ